MAIDSLYINWGQVTVSVTSLMIDMIRYEYDHKYDWLKVIKERYKLARKIFDEHNLEQMTKNHSEEILAKYIPVCSLASRLHLLPLKVQTLSQIHLSILFIALIIDNSTICLGYEGLQKSPISSNTSINFNNVTTFVLCLTRSNF